MSQKQRKTELLHKEYLQSLKKEKRLTQFWQLLIFVTFFGLWEIASQNHWIDPLIFSSPTKVWNLFITKIGDGSLLVNLQVTLFETILGFIFNGQVEGQINWLKAIKRQMYGRAGFNLLRARVLPYRLPTATAHCHPP